MKVYVVNGSTGEYSDWRSWVACGFIDRVKAESHMADCQKWEDEHKPAYADRFDYEKTPPNPHDPKVQRDYTGQKYFIEEIEVRE